MRGRKRWLMILSSAVFGLLLLAAFRHRAEPSYDGHKLSYWVVILNNSADDDPLTSRATNAIAHIGTKALPQLLQWIQYESSPWRQRLAGLIEQAPSTLSAKAAESVRNPERAQLAAGAVDAIKVLGPTAIPVLRDLSRLMNDPTAPETAEAATEALCYLGTNALPFLLTVLNNPDHPCRWEAVSSIGEMPGLSEAAALAAPALIACLTDTNAATTPPTAAQVLAELKCDASVWIIPLAAALFSTNEDTERSSARMLEALGMSDSMAEALTNALTDTNAHVRFLAGHLLDRIPPELLTNRPVPIH